MFPGPGWLNELHSNSYKPIANTTWVRARLCKLQNRCTRPAAASDKVYQLLAHGRWFSPGIPASSTTKSGRHDIGGSGVKHKKNQINYVSHVPLFIKPHYHVPKLLLITSLIQNISSCIDLLF
jgi:hypothetical protein